MILEFVKCHRFVRNSFTICTCLMLHAMKCILRRMKLTTCISQLMMQLCHSLVCNYCIRVNLWENIIETIEKYKQIRKESALIPMYNIHV